MANICDYIKESINEGEFLRSVIYISGCKHECKKCFSPQTWSFKYGTPFTLGVQNKIVRDIKDNHLIKGITICGGDSFYSSRDMIEFIKLFKTELPEHTVWAYTGFTLEEILNSSDKYMIEYLKLIDVLIDGRFKEELKDLTLKFRGSENQRIIDVQQSLKQNEVVLYDI